VIYEFANFSLDLARRELRCDGRSIHVEPQTFDVLQYLVTNRERVVSKDDLIAAVWKGRIVSESTLSSSIATVRKAVGPLTPAIESTQPNSTAKRATEASDNGPGRSGACLAL